VRESWGRVRLAGNLLSLAPQRTLILWIHSLCKCSWFFWYKVLWLVNLYSFLLVGLSSVLVADTLVEDPDKDR
jgi:hypothetical protein